MSSNRAQRLTLICLLALSACTTSTSPRTAAEIASQVAKQQDQFLKVDTIASPTIGEPVFGEKSLQLLYFLDHDSLIYTGPFLRIVQYRSHSDPTVALFVRSARDLNATTLRVAHCDQLVKEYGTYEVTTLLLPVGYLEAHREGGTLIRLYGSQQSADIEVPPALIAGFLDGSAPLLIEHGIPEGEPPTPMP